jgi:hypothetical protein
MQRRRNTLMKRSPPAEAMPNNGARPGDEPEPTFSAVRPTDYRPPPPLASALAELVVDVARRRVAARARLAARADQADPPEVSDSRGG